MCHRGERGATKPLLPHPPLRSGPLSLCYLEKPDFGMLQVWQDKMHGLIQIPTSF
jgi:hypothetical protein